MFPKILLCATLLTVTATAQAANITLPPDLAALNPTLGFGYALTDAGFQNDIDLLAENTYHTAFVSAGIRPTDRFGAELFYQHAKNETTQIGTLKTKTGFQAVGIDALGFYPLTQKTELMGALGVGYYQFEADLSGAANLSADEDNLGWRFGVGADYRLTDKWSCRGMLRYVKLNTSSNDAVDDITEMSIGVYYHF